jgi:very-short-patch-repair endonuclease
MPDDLRSFLRQRAREMRGSMTAAERMLWSHLRNDQLDGHRFRRQQPVGPYVADFMCPRLSLIVEVEGDSHATAEQMEWDRVRTEYLNEHGVQVIRFANAHVLNHIGDVLDQLRCWMSEHVAGAQAPLPSPLPGVPGRGG